MRFIEIKKGEWRKKIEENSRKRRNGGTKNEKMRAKLSRRQMNTDMEEVEEAREYVGGG